MILDINHHPGTSPFQFDMKNKTYNEEIEDSNGLESDYVGSLRKEKAASQTPRSNKNVDRRSPRSGQKQRPNFRGKSNTRRFDSRQSQPSYMTMNLSTALVTTKFINLNLIDKSFRSIKDETIVLSYKIKPIKDKLDAQAQVWSRKIISDQNLYLRGILSSQSDKWQDLLESAYIYNFYREVLYALTDSRVAEMPKKKTSLIGFAVLHKFLLQPSYTFQYDDFFVKYQLICNDDDLKYIIKEAKQYSFIREYILESPRFHLENEVLDRILDGLKDHIFGDGPRLITLEDESLINNYLTLDNFPIGNSCYTSEGNVDKWFFSPQNGKTVLDSSTLFGKACFITSVDDKKFQEFFDLNLKSDSYYLTKYEVTCICGSVYPNYVKNESPSK